MPKFWISVVTEDHVKECVVLGIAQFSHGKLAPTKRVSKGDWVLYFSSKFTVDGTEPCQKFTAIGQITDDKPHQVVVTKTFKPYRRHAKYLKRAKSVEIRPLLEQLPFIKVKARWGYIFRMGFFEIDARSFAVVYKKMTGKSYL